MIWLFPMTLLLLYRGQGAGGAVQQDKTNLIGLVGLKPYLEGRFGLKPYLAGKVANKPAQSGESGNRG